MEKQLIHNLNTFLKILINWIKLPKLRIQRNLKDLPSNIKLNKDLNQPEDPTRLRGEPKVTAQTSLTNNRLWLKQHVPKQHKPQPANPRLNLPKLEIPQSGHQQLSHTRERRYLGILDGQELNALEVGQRVGWLEILADAQIV